MAAAGQTHRLVAPEKADLRPTPVTRSDRSLRLALPGLAVQSMIPLGFGLGLHPLGFHGGGMRGMLAELPRRSRRTSGIVDGPV